MAKILLVDTSRPYSIIAGVALSKIGGHEVTTANTLQEGINSLIKESFDLLVTGWLFPGENAGGLAEQFLNLERPVIINSSFKKGEVPQIDGFVTSHDNVVQITCKGDTQELLEKIETSLETISSLERVRGGRSVEG